MKFKWLLITLFVLLFSSVAFGQNYLGCFKDQGDPYGTSGRDISGYVFNSDTMTVDQCVGECGQRGFKFAGVQYSKWCFCGDSYGKSGNASNCNMSCAGNSSQICGGSYANSVYGTIHYFSSGYQPPVNNSYRAVGCYRDNSNRDLNGYSYNNATMNTQQCVAECSKRGFRYAGTQYSSWCFCDNDYGKYGSANNCNMRCSGNNSEICGGSWANNVYEIMGAR